MINGGVRGRSFVRDGANHKFSGIFELSEVFRWRLAGLELEVLVKRRFGVETTVVGQGQKSEAFTVGAGGSLEKTLQALGVDIMIECFLCLGVDHLRQLVGRHLEGFGQIL